ncbi:MAG: hypothetical protein HGA85_08925 [Nanoarchaeota archaeon]|nr:hypothetical protein [Nanoarchaeota archaeon]
MTIDTIVFLEKLGKVIPYQANNLDPTGNVYTINQVEAAIQMALGHELKPEEGYQKELGLLIEKQVIETPMVGEYHLTPIGAATYFNHLHPEIGIMFTPKTI